MREKPLDRGGAKFTARVFGFLDAERVLRVDATPAVTASRLAEHVAAKRFRLRGPQERFTGRVTGACFQMTRTLGPFERSSFAPVIDGEITPAGDGAELRIRMRLNRFVAACSALFGLGYWLMSASFSGEAKRATALLCEALGAYPPDKHDLQPPTR